MKTFKSPLILATCFLAVAFPASVRAQAGSGTPNSTGNQSETGKTTSSRSSGTTGASAPSGVSDSGSSSGATLAASSITDPAALFRQLDSDRDGKLSEQEFSRIQSLMGRTSGAGTRTGTGAGTTVNGTPSTGGSSSTGR